MAVKNNAFSEEVLADKLAKLNNTQQCIETLSHWCIYHRNDAELIVQTWEKQFHSSGKEQKIPFLYLANDILQNSKRNGTEFVEEFWKVLPGALKDVTENGDDRGKKVVSRLVDIWQERRVFGSRAGGIKDVMLGTAPLPVLDMTKKRSHSSGIKIVKRDYRSVKLLAEAMVEEAANMQWRLRNGPVIPLSKPASLVQSGKSLISWSCTCNARRLIGRFT